MAELEIPDRAYECFDRGQRRRAVRIAIAAELRRLAPMMRCYSDMRALVVLADELDPPCGS